MIRSICLAALAALALSACDSGAGDGAQETAATDTQSAAPPPPQLPGQIVRAFAGTPLPAQTFEGPDGNTLDLAALDQPILLNLWATWCVPCVVEMPMLDTLAGEMDGEIRVITISQDMRGAEVVGPFFAQRDLPRLEQWLDPRADLSAAFAEGGLLPMTILFDSQGNEVFRIAGAYEWDSEEAIARIREALADVESGA
ncbi:MAG: TlpA disulfide reductase family protein [Erythrobacter sp.]